LTAPPAAPPAGPGTAPRRAVVIGGGIGGMSCACMLAKEGIDTVLLEKNKIIGGTAGGFYFRGLHLELGCNVSGPAGDGRALTRFLDYFGIAGEAAPRMLQQDSCIRVVSGAEEIMLPAGLENFIRAVADRFPADRAGILKFGEKARFIMDNLRALNIPRYFDVSPDLEMSSLMAADSVSDNLEGIKSPMARRLLSLFWRFTGTPPAVSPMSLYGPVMGCFLDGPCILSGESLLAALERKFKAWGGRIETRSAVSRIRVRSGEVKGVETQGGEVHEADIVVSTIHPLGTIRLLQDTGLLQKMKRRLERAGETCGVFVAYFLPGDDVAGDPGGPRWNLLLGDADLEGSSTLDAESLQDTDISVFVSRHGGSAPEVMGAHVIVPAGAFSRWEATLTRKRGAQYEKMKETAAGKIKERLQASMPGCGSGLSVLTSISSLTMRDELGHAGGSFGVLRSARLKGMATCGWMTPVKGLMQGGQSVLYPGIVGTMETSLLIMAAILGEKTMVERFSSG
jgi:all-trans-retinol 13,14-reductase